METLATISTHEANNKSSTSAADTTLSHMPVVSMSSAAGASSDTEEIQTVAITMEQLEQLKAGGTNIVYMVSGRASRVMKGLINNCFYLDETSKKGSFAIFNGFISWGVVERNIVGLLPITSIHPNVLGEHLICGLNH